MKLDEFIKAVSTEKKRVLLRYIDSGKDKGVNIRKFPGPYAYNNLYEFVREWISNGIVEECGKTEKGKTFPQQAVLYRLTKDKGKKILGIVDYLEKKVK